MTDPSLFMKILWVCLHKYLICSHKFFVWICSVVGILHRTNLFLWSSCWISVGYLCGHFQYVSHDFSFGIPPIFRRNRPRYFYCESSISVMMVNNRSGRGVVIACVSEISWPDFTTSNIDVYIFDKFPSDPHTAWPQSPLPVTDLASRRFITSSDNIKAKTKHQIWLRRDHVTISTAVRRQEAIRSNKPQPIFLPHFWIFTNMNGIR